LNKTVRNAYGNNHNNDFCMQETNLQTFCWFITKHLVTRLPCKHFHRYSHVI